MPISFADTAGAKVEVKKAGAIFLKKRHLGNVTFLIVGNEPGKFGGTDMKIRNPETPFEGEYVVNLSEGSGDEQRLLAIESDLLKKGVLATFKPTGETFNGHEIYELAAPVESPSPWPDMEAIQAEKAAMKAQREEEQAKKNEQDGDFPF